MPDVLVGLTDVLPEGMTYYLALPIVSGLFHGALGVAVSASLGYQNRGLFDNLMELARVDFLEGEIPALPADAGFFACYGAYFLLAVSGATLGACFSYLHEDPRAEMLVSAPVYLVAVAYIATGGGC